MNSFIFIPTTNKQEACLLGTPEYILFSFFTVKLTTIETFTHSSPDWAKTDDGPKVRLCSRGHCCFTNRLDNPSINDFELGAHDVFEGSRQFGQCESLEIYLTDLEVYLHSTGDDGWWAQKVLLRFDNGSSLTCLMNQWIETDGTRSSRIFCS